MRVALFDFCNTLVDFSTADSYIGYILEHLDASEREKRTHKHRILRKLHIIQAHDLLVSKKILENAVYLNKRVFLECIKGLTESDLEDFGKAYYTERVKPHLVKETVSELKVRKTEGYRIAIVSGGYDFYLKFFAYEFGVEDLICTHIEIVKGKATGRIAGTDCMNARKVSLLDDYYKGMGIDRSNSYAYSDSRSDLPMLQWAGNGVVVARGMEPQWAKKNGLRCMIWQGS